MGAKRPLVVDSSITAFHPHQTSKLHLQHWVARSPPSDGSPTAILMLGPVDGFDQDEGASKGYECTVAVLGFITTHGNALEALQLADGLLDSGTRLVERSWKELRLFLAFSRYGITGMMPRRRQAARLAAES